ncbi:MULTISPECIES: hypothetical protein [Nostoc]|uniref:Uncharacterized protein n=1 Tax=Nostoc punctiforme FACHB-252 TaxID=1357509 RepID=A0ABR8HIA7_NOSPU|nr:MULTISPECIES: hypothetical protein [Nostoc]MBC1237102.1 hypothetical protein [Nostoc sp. 2RC]MBD2615585.1 hypothetical protein [Nostoc punctiforme FACHB-252]
MSSSYPYYIAWTDPLHLGDHNLCHWVRVASRREERSNRNIYLILHNDLTWSNQENIARIE